MKNQLFEKIKNLNL